MHEKAFIANLQYDKDNAAVAIKTRIMTCDKSLSFKLDKAHITPLYDSKELMLWLMTLQVYHKWFTVHIYALGVPHTMAYKVMCL